MSSNLTHQFCLVDANVASMPHSFMQSAHHNGPLSWHCRCPFCRVSHGPDQINIWLMPQMVSGSCGAIVHSFTGSVTTTVFCHDTGHQLTPLFNDSVLHNMDQICIWSTPMTVASIVALCGAIAHSFQRSATTDGSLPWLCLIVDALSGRDSHDCTNWSINP